MIKQREADIVVSATDAKNNFGSVISRVADTGESVVVERQGKPRAAIISMEKYRMLSALETEQRRQEAVANLRKLQAEISEKFKDLSEDEIEEIAQEIRNEVTQGLFDKGIVRYAE